MVDISCIMSTMITKSSVSTNLRLTPEAKWLLQKWAKKLGITMTSVIEMAIREFDERREAKHV